MNTDENKKLQEQIDKLEKKLEKISDYVKMIDYKHENVMNSVLEHLVHQATVLKSYSNTKLPASLPSISNTSSHVTVSSEEHI